MLTVPLALAFALAWPPVPLASPPVVRLVQAGVTAPSAPAAHAPVRPRVKKVPPNRLVAVLGQPVTGPDGRVVGRLIDVLVNSSGAPEAAVIDFGGFMGVGSRKIAVHWDTLRFLPGSPHARIRITLLPAEIAAAPQFKGTHRAAPVVVARHPAPPAAAAPH